MQSYHIEEDIELTPDQRRFLELCTRAPWHAKIDADERMALVQRLAANVVPPNDERTAD